MKLFRLVHKNVIHSLYNEPFYGCVSYHGRPYFYAFDSVITALVENSIYHSLGKIPRTIVAIEYTLPDHSLHVVAEDPVYRDNFLEAYHLREWIDRFLKHNVALVAAFPSNRWAWAQLHNYIINPKHDLFQEIKISNIQKIYR